MLAVNFLMSGNTLTDGAGKKKKQYDTEGRQDIMVKFVFHGMLREYLIKCMGSAL